MQMFIHESSCSPSSIPTVIEGEEETSNPYLILGGSVHEEDIQAEVQKDVEDRRKKNEELARQAKEEDEAQQKAAYTARKKREQEAAEQKKKVRLGGSANNIFLFACGLDLLGHGLLIYQTYQIQIMRRPGARLIILFHVVLMFL